jgi:hypothetical protein
MSGVPRNSRRSRADSLDRGRAYHRSMDSVELNTLLPLACDWAEQQERRIQDEGVPLTDAQIQDAIKIGIAHPKRVRLLRVDPMPSPQHPALQEATLRIRMNWATTGGLTVRYGIFIHSNCWSNRHLIAHELTHTMQYERFGSMTTFLRSWLTECFLQGYGNGPLELEAEKMANQLYPLPQ